MKTFLEKAEKALKGLGLLDYRSSTRGEIKIYDSVKINKVVVALDAAGVDISAINSSEGSVEDYYLNLVKEAK